MIGAAHVEGMLALEAKHDPELIVDANRVMPCQFPVEGVQVIAWWHTQILDPRHGVDLIQLSLDDGPEGPRNPPCRLTIDAVPHVGSRRIGEGSDQSASTIARLVC